MQFADDIVLCSTRPEERRWKLGERVSGVLSQRTERDNQKKDVHYVSKTRP